MADEHKQKVPKFKNFTLNQQDLRTTFTDEDFNKIFSISTSRGGALGDAPADFEMVEAQSPFVDAAIQQSMRGLTENRAPTFKTSGDARVDFLFHVMEQTCKEDTLNYLKKSWDNQPLDTLKLVAHLRSIKDGKGIRRQYHECLLWMYHNHPKTLYENLEELLRFGYWKDALQMLLVICFDGFVHSHLSNDDIGKGSHTKAIRLMETSKKRKWKLSCAHIQEKEAYNRIIRERYAEEPLNAEEGQKPKKHSKKDMEELRLRFARDKFDKDLKYRIFHTRIAQVFAKQLKEDLDGLKAIQSKEKAIEGGAGPEISLAAKWAPSLEAHFDRYLLIASSIAVELVHLLDSSKSAEIQSKPLPVAVYLCRRMYHKEFCVPLRAHQDLAEIHMSGRNWSKVNYKRVPSKCMKRNTPIFLEHDGDRFREYIKKPEAKVAGAALKPVEILEKAMTLHHAQTPDEVQVIEKQWVSLCDSVKAKGGGLLKNSLSVCDVSGSMSGTPMTAALGLTLMTMTMSSKPWDSVCVTFHETPSFHHVDSSASLMTKLESLRDMEWGNNTDLHQVFQLIVNMGKENKLSDADMPKILFIFTDMEFDEACRGTTQTNFEAAKTLFTQNGYSMPTIVFWNLRASPKKSSTPVQANEMGVLLMSGFSAQSLSYIMNTDDVSKLDPLNFVLEIVNNKLFSKLQIYD